MHACVADVGHYNFGWRGNKEARTPNIDSLVAQGLILDRQYVFKYCSPTRSSFLSGRLPVHVNTANRGPSDAGGVHIGMSTVADILTGAGYTAHQVVSPQIIACVLASWASRRAGASDLLTLLVRQNFD